MGEFLMPSLGADMKEGILVEWRVKPGDRVKRGDIIAEVETEKGIIEIEVFEDGIIVKILVQPGEKVPVGAVLAIIRTEEEKAEEGPEVLTPEAQLEGQAFKYKACSIDAHRKALQPEQPSEIQASDTATEERIRISPLARRLADELGVDMGAVKGTGPGGAVNRADIERTAEAEKTAKKAEGKVAGKPVEAGFQAGMRRAIAAAMARSNREIPHYYLETRIDMSPALAWLSAENKKRSVKERILPAIVLIKAVALALGDVPELNGYWIDDRHQVREAVHIGFAIALRQGGLVAPAIHNVDLKRLDELMQDLRDLITRTRAGRLRSSEMTDATITITSLGDLGVETVYGVIYPPQVALVGFGKITEQPWAKNGMLGVRSVLTATLAADHRATDGHRGAQFMESLNRFLQNPEKL